MSLLCLGAHTDLWGCCSAGSLGGMARLPALENADLGILSLPSCLSHIHVFLESLAHFLPSTLVSFPLLSAPFHSVNSDVCAF